MYNLSDKVFTESQTAFARNRYSTIPNGKVDLSGPFPTTMSGNKYIIAFVDWYSGWPEAFPVPDKTGDTVAD